MEFVGRKVKKGFKGFGFFTGTIQSYDESSKLFEIVYEDGDLEELDFSEVVSRLKCDRGGKATEVEAEAEAVHVKPRLGRKPKKRRRLEGKRGESGKVDKNLENLDLNDGLVDLNDGFVENFREIDGVNGKFDLSGECKETLGKDVRENGGLVNGNLIVDAEIENGIDLNAGLNFKSYEGLNLNLNDGGNLKANLSLEKKKRECIDLNLEVNGELEDNMEFVETQKKECGFDLNVGVDDENKDDTYGDRVAQVNELTSLHIVGEGVVTNGALTEVHVAQNVCLESVGGVPKEDSMLVKDFVSHDNSNGVQLKEDFATPSSTVIDACQGDIGSSYKQLSGRRKRRKVVDNLNSVTETVLRRSARRGSARNNVLSSKTSLEVNDLPSSMADVSMEELPVTLDAERVEDPMFNPPKLHLPPSSQNLDLEGIPILDVFAIYACLRSFSTLLFLSPFELEDFVAALKCRSPNLLFDCIHVSILLILKKHLEHLTKEGSESASDCLRSLNWGLLDMITWPIFMAEYFLIHSSGLKPGFELIRLKLFSSEYCKQPVSVKVEILRCLCDDMIEVEAIRMELNRRSSVAEPDMDFDRNINNEIGKRRRVVMDMSAGSCLTEEVVDDANDWNSDECCLCKMDGNLLCCDGCPAAYHSKCVGVANDLLPEGDWFCPECALDRHKPWMKPCKSLRGAELLGVDPHGRLYFCSCGYLLVSDSCDTEFILNYYHKDDLNVVIDVLKSSDIFYGAIINAVCKQWDITFGSNGMSNLALNTVYSSRHDMKVEVPTINMPKTSVVSAETHIIMSEIDNEQKPEENIVAGYSSRLDSAVCKSVNLLYSVTAVEIPNISSEGSAETTQMNSGFENFQKGHNNSIRATEFSNQSEIAGKLPPPRGSSITSSSSDIKQKFAYSGCYSYVTNSKKGDTLQFQPEIAYMNHYSFAQTASSVAEELMRKSSNEISKELIISYEEIISTQMKAILKKWDKFYWPNTQKLNADKQKEKCGWCFSCKVPTDDMDCLFNMNNGRVLGSLESEVAGLLSTENKKGHVVDVICHILSIEDRLLGLLLGPWLNPHYTKLWRKSALKATDLVSVKHLLLTLEANLHHRALSAEWLKHVDSVATMGSASHIVIASSRASSKAGVVRKKARDFDANPSPKAAGGLSLCWWRGGRVSCQLFSWKHLPRSLVSKAARQAGCMKIPGILYLESSDFAKRSRNVAWRAAVESSTSVEQLAIQVREFDSNVRWDDVENTHPLCTMDKEFRKSVRLFKKAIIRRKCLKEEGVKYLVDFGKRRCVPDIIKKHGSMAEESSSGRKKFWLNESYVPLHLLKSFEERRISRKSTKLNSGKLSEPSIVMKKSSRERGFSYLFSIAARSEYYQCGHCLKDVLIRDAAGCQDCKGYFHKRHIRKSAGAVTAECKCYRCQDGRFKDTRTAKSGAKKGKVNTRSVKVKSQKSKNITTGYRPVQSKNGKGPVVGGRTLRSRNEKKVAAIPLRRSARRAKLVSVQNKKHGGRKRGRPKSKKKTYQKQKRGTLRKKRTQSYYSYWLDGLLLSRKPDDERVMQFRMKNFLAASELLMDTLDQPKCSLCHEAEYTSTSNYIACEICGEWYHGGAFGLKAENISKLIGFRCHVCRKRTPPVCPCMVSMGSDGSQLDEAQTNHKIESSEELCKHAVFGELKSIPMSNSNEDHQVPFPVDDCFLKEEELCSGMLESRLEAKEHELVSNELNTDSIHISDDDLKSDILTANENGMLEDNTVRSGHDVTVALHDQAEPPSYKFDVDSMDTDTALLRHGKEMDGLVKTMPILNSPMDGTLMDSNVLHSEMYVTSDKFLDENKTF